MAIDFPLNPSVNDEFTDGNGTIWVCQASDPDPHQWARKGAQATALPVGSIIMWGGLIGSVPTGWQIADGTNGTVDLRGRFARGIDVGATGVDPDGERVVGNVQLDEFKSHIHSVPDTHILSGSSGAAVGVQDPTDGESGATGGDETRPVNVAVYYIQKVS